jgi:L-fuconolactonase
LIVDTHHHLWLIDESDLWWLTDADRAAGGAHLHDFGLAEMRETFDTVGTDRSVLVEAWGAEADQHHWLGLAEDDPTIGAVVTSTNLAAPDAGAVIDRLRVYSKFRGLRLASQDIADPDHLAREDIRRGVREFASRDNVSLDLLLKIDDLKDVPRLAEENPGLPMILNHLAKPQTSESGYFMPWAEQIELLEPYPQIHFKISGMLTEAGPEPSTDLLRPAVRFMIETFGYERLMWGSDWPVSLLAGSYRHNHETTVAAMGAMDEEQSAAFLGGNAIDFYRIE